MTILQTKLDDQTELLVELNDSKTGIENTSFGSSQTATVLAENAFKTALNVIKKVSLQLVDVKNQLPNNLNAEVEFSFGIKFSAEGNIWLAKTAAEAQLTTTIKWK